jgi:hypothetical protein
VSSNPKEAAGFIAGSWLWTSPQTSIQVLAPLLIVGETLGKLLDLSELVFLSAAKWGYTFLAVFF